MWLDFKAFFPDVNLDKRRPKEEELRQFFMDMRTVRGCAATTIWTNFSMVNSMCKGKYSFDLRNLPRIITLLKSFEGAPKKKAAIFTVEELRAFCEAEELEGAYWLVRKAIVILAYFGGLRLTEAMALTLEKIEARAGKGTRVYHSRAKQRTDKLNTKFDVPNKEEDRKKQEEERKKKGDNEDDVVGFDWSECLSQYVRMVKEELGQYKGRVFYTGRKDGKLTKQVMGRNMVAQVSHQVADWLGKENVDEYTFHSFRRSAATAAADQGATAQQMVDFFGWKNQSMTSEYISTSDYQLKNMAMKLAGSSTEAGTGGTGGTGETGRTSERGMKKARDVMFDSSEEEDDEEEGEEEEKEQERVPKKKVLKRDEGKKVIIINM